ncbi:MAG: LamG-like jellyroll fold domain-containing protein [Parcubacteria group bacterium]
MAPEFYYKRSFTLIELLVVIAIIGLLASIVVVNVNSARDKAKIAKSIQFSSSVYHALGAEAVGYWDFNEIVGGTVRDVSGNGNTGTVNGATLVDSLVFSGGNLGKALSFDGLNDSVSFGTSISMSNSSAISLEAWVKNNGNNGADYAQIVGRFLEYAFQCSTIANSNQILFNIRGTDAAWHSTGGYVTFTPGDWTHLVGVYNSLLASNNIKIYMNGVLEKQATYAGGISTGVNNTGISSYPARFVNYSVDQVRIYSQALGAAEIQKHYAEGLEKHQLAKE